MQSPSSQASLPPFSQDRTMASSIWAPQPQPNEPTWSKSPMCRYDGPPGLEKEQSLRPEARYPFDYPTFHHEGAFGPTGFPPNGRKKDIGAIGDGRRSSDTPDIYSIHVEQLFRTLNLNSPDSYTGGPSPSIGLTESPELSPSSAASVLMTPTDMSPARTFDHKFHSAYEPGRPMSPPRHAVAVPHEAPHRTFDVLQPPQLRSSLARVHPDSIPAGPPSSMLPIFEPFAEHTVPSVSAHSLSPLLRQPLRRVDSPRHLSGWRQEHSPSSEWTRFDEYQSRDQGLGIAMLEDPLRLSLQSGCLPPSPPQHHAHEPINFLSLLHPSSSPPYHLFVARIIKSSDQQASIFLQQKLKVADAEERMKIVDAICARGFEMMAHRFGNWAVQRCLEAASTPDERRKIVMCMRGRVVELATNCYGCHVLQKALDCEEDIRLLIVSELLLGDPAQTLVNKHASHVWSKIMELSWTPPAPPIFAYVNKALKGKWAALACHETGSLVVQHAFENLEESAKDDIVDELLNRGSAVFAQVAKNQWGSYCIQHVLEHGSAKHRKMALDHLVAGLLEYATNEQGAKSVTKALKEGGKDTLDKIIKRMCEPARGGRRATIVDLALSATGSQLIATVLPSADKDQRGLLYDSIRGHIVTLRGCKTGSKVIWLFDRMRAYYGY